jgi:hypothetical protein
MDRVFLLLLLVFTQNLSMAQNLIPNPSFENFLFCPVDMNYDRKTFPVLDWSLANHGTPDYFNSCNKFNVGVPVNVMGNCFAAEGHGYVGLILLEKPEFTDYDRKKAYNYREYIQCSLTYPLEKDVKYIFTMKYSVAEYSRYCVNRLGVLISIEKIKSRTMDPLLFKPTFQIDTTDYCLIPGAWYELCDTIFAKGGEKYVTIGNFFNDCQTEYVNMDEQDLPPFRKNRVIEESLAYYYIDMIELQVINTNSIEISSP